MPFKLKVLFSDSLLALAFLVCVVFALPVLSAELSGPPTGKFPLEIKSYIATRLFNRNSPLKQLGHIVFFWIQFLPLNLGIAYILGLPAVLAYAPKHTEARVFHSLSIAAIIGYLLAVQFFQSVVGANDFAWRGVLIPVLLLLIWAAIALAELPDKLNHEHWRANSWLLRCHQAILPLACIGLTLGILSTCLLWKFPKPHRRYDPPSAEQLVAHQDFFQLRHAWDAVLSYTQPNELVQSNPDSYTDVITPRLAAPMAMVLFGDRAMAYSGLDTVQIFAHSYDTQQKETQYTAVQALFKADPSIKTLRYARDRLHIKALIIDWRDPVWASSAIDTSGVYQLAEQDPNGHYKIYVAK